MNLLSSIGRGIKGAGRGILSGIDNAAVNSLTGGGLMDAALGSNGQPFTPTDQQQKGLRGQYLMGIGSALQQGRPIAEGIQQYQQNAIGQIQAGQQAQQQAQSRQVQQAFNQEMQAANRVEAKLAVVGKYSSALGPAATKQYADAITSMRAPVDEVMGQPFEIQQGGKPVMVQQRKSGILTPVEGYAAPERPFQAGGNGIMYDQRTGLSTQTQMNVNGIPMMVRINGRTGQFIDPASGEPITQNPVTEYERPQREGNPTEASLALTAAKGDALKALQLLRQQNATQGGGDGSKLLSVTEAAQLGVPYGTTKAQAAGKSPATRQQDQIAGYANRIVQSNEQLARMEPDIAATSAASMWYGSNAPNVMKSGQMQVYDQLQRNFINAVLRQESGAVISKSEFENAYKQYFPQPGDGEKVIAQKRQNRAVVQQQFIKAAGNAYTPMQTQGSPITRYNPATRRFEK